MSLKGLKKEFSQMQKAYEKNDKIRDQVIILSRTILKSSKQAIYALHRDDVNKSENLLKIAEKNTSQILTLLKKYNSKSIGAFNAALEEYVEAKCYMNFSKNKSFPTAKQLKVSPEIYLAGLSDCTGELARKALKSATNQDYKTVKRINNILEELMELFLDIEFRGIDMRKKLEGIKYNVTKTQNILYDIQMKGGNHEN